MVPMHPAIMSHGEVNIGEMSVKELDIYILSA